MRSYRCEQVVGGTNGEKDSMLNTHLTEHIGRLTEPTASGLLSFICAAERCSPDVRQAIPAYSATPAGP